MTDTLLLLKDLLKRAAAKAVDLVYPARCPVCDNAAPYGEKICLDCLRSLKALRYPWCEKCGKKLNFGEGICGDCKRNEHSFVRCRSVFEYPCISNPVYRFKYLGRREYAAFFAESSVKILGDYLAMTKPDAIVCVPLSKRKMLKRGYNQAEDYAGEVSKLTNIPLDLHLMIKDPEYKFQWIGIKDTDIVSIHYESTFQVQRALDYLQPFGCKRFLAINPATPVSSLEEVLEYIDGINLLMVNPGFAGQKIVPSTIKKAEKVMELIKREKREDIIIEVDGNITPDNGKRLREIGASMFVCGTSAIFKGELSQYEENIINFRNCVR